MLGAGTKTDTTISRDFKALLDVSRLVSRVGYGPHTGVDRVELAYLEWCLSTDETLYGLARIAGGFSLLDRIGLNTLYKKLTGKSDWGRRDARGLIGLKTSPLRARAESDVRRLAAETNKRPQFQSVDLSSFVYLNTGHSNLSTDSLAAISAQVASIATFLHDVIPLEFPQYQRPNTVEAFQKKLRSIDQYSDVVLVNSEDTKSRSEPYLRHAERLVVAHLGIDVPPEPSAKSGMNRPYFVTIGTIEPRKNHTLLLDVWEGLSGNDIPHLHIIGRRGWKNEEVFARLDKAKLQGSITEHSDMSDASMWPLLRDANALLFPSFAEGFGLPSLEAAALGVPVICGDLAIHRELLGDYPVYVDLQDPYLWQKTILEQTQATKHTSRPTPHIPTWDEHFARVNQAITEKR